MKDDNFPYGRDGCCKVAGKIEQINSQANYQCVFCAHKSIAPTEETFQSLGCSVFCGEQ